MARIRPFGVSTKCITLIENTGSYPMLLALRKESSGSITIGSTANLKVGEGKGLSGDEDTWMILDPGDQLYGVGSTPNEKISIVEMPLDRTLTLFVEALNRRR